jgi:hemolysin D
MTAERWWRRVGSIRLESALLLLRDGLASHRPDERAVLPAALVRASMAFAEALTVIRGKLLFLLDGLAGRGPDERAFLPAALEIVETPPPPLAGAIGGTIIALFCVALAWACFGRVDIVATATGRIVPSGRTKVIQPLETGLVRAIHVRDGQSVKAGEVLVELDPTVAEVELHHMRSDLMAAQFEAARLRAALAGPEDPLPHFRPPAGAGAEAIDLHRRLLRSEAAEQKAKIEGLRQQESQKEAERATIRATINKLNETLPLLEERVNLRRYLFDKELGSRLSYLSDYQDLVGQQQDLLVQKSHYREADAAVAALVEAELRTGSEYQRTVLNDLNKAEQKAAGLAQDVVKATQRAQYQALAAPVDGTVQQLAIHTVGGVVTAAQALMVVVPALEIEAMVSNRDIGFIHVGDDVQVKIDTFNFTLYGTLHGTVLSVSQDAIARNKPLDNSSNQAAGATTTSSEPKGQELVYAARVSLDRAQMRVDDNRVNLSPGMAVTAEITTGSRRIITYLLSPLLRYGHESLRER